MRLTCFPECPLIVMIFRFRASCNGEPGDCGSSQVVERHAFDACLVTGFLKGILKTVLLPRLARLFCKIVPSVPLTAF